MTNRTPPAALEGLPPVVADAVADALGAGHRRDPVEGRTGGPAGNAVLTAWLGLLLLVALAAELVTLLDVRGLLGWHAGVGAVIGALVVGKAAATGWRVARYYRGAPSYRVAGPPPTVFRVLGPLVVLSALAVLGTGFALVALGADSSRQVLLTALGHRVDAVTLHQAAFIVFGVLVALHALGRLVPALDRVGRRLGRAVPGARWRWALLAGVGVVAVLGVVLVLPLTHGWTGGGFSARTH